MELFQTERLFIRRFTPGDADDFYSFNGDPEVMKYIRPAKDREGCDAFLAENISLYDPGNVAGRYFTGEKETKRFVGTFSLLQIPGEDGMHIGYGLLPAFQGKGYALEMLMGGTDFFFRNRPDPFLMAITEKENTASQKVLRKAGYMFHADLQQHKPLYMYRIARPLSEQPAV
ncbi:GNAT family N-acetyltransferase [Sediminibacterium ginsengisoli]|uniref:Protein N-acetyltransferase, RimJ/RimL family n=1 Tax=Sediminibacterium ginsengisoli TaxID=413434 RepID=A0A1T4QRB3_9BACT|nr:GNAT family N-acetyltransferase [Sediminibacterium ginsengisoli]SKA05788.1 Protein N-acetyltransferase, RimJ/RimL family [Sediminibacterium ginsengisoli]